MHNRSITYFVVYQSILEAILCVIFQGLIIRFCREHKPFFKLNCIIYINPMLPGPWKIYNPQIICISL